MKLATFTIVTILGIFPLFGDTVRVTVGDTGCPGRQLAVKHLWEKIDGVSSVTVLSRQQDQAAASRTFVIVSEGTCPNSAQLKSALGRRAERYPILVYQPVVKQP